MKSTYGQYCPVALASEVLGQRWARDLEVEDLDPRHLIWSVHLRLNLDAMPPGRTTIQFEFKDVRQVDRFYWIVVNNRNVDVCLKHPGHEPDVSVVSKLLRFIDAWRGFRSMEQEVNAGRIKVAGPREMRTAFASWMLLSSVAHVSRQRKGRERTLQRRTQRSLI